MRTILALLGATLGYGFCVFVPTLACAAIDPTKIPAAIIIVACGAAFCVLGIRLASTLVGRRQRTNPPQKWQTTLASLGAAIGPAIGYFAVYCVNPEGKSDVHGPAAEFARSFLGAPLGALVFCLLGLYVGEALDGRSKGA